MDHIIFNDSDWFNESYALNPAGVFGEDVGEWTAEEFYGYGCDCVYMEAAGEDSLLTRVISKLYDKSPAFAKWIEGVSEKRAAKASAAALKHAQLSMEAPAIAKVMEEIQTSGMVKSFWIDVKLRLAIVWAASIAFNIIRICTHEIMFQKKWGRFPADLKSFYEYVFEMPAELSKEDIKRFKNELKKLRKDTKWLTGKAGNEFITPKERKHIELMDEQLKDLLTWRMIPQDVETQKVHRIMDRLKQFIETSYDFLESIHSDMVDTKTKNRMSDALK
jgi:hypothetical protein